MGTRMLREVIDHYRGPDAKSRWLVAFAFSARDETRTGWPGRELMAWRVQKSAARTSNMATELVRDGVIKRVGGGGKGRGNTRYVLLPIIAPDGCVCDRCQGSPSPNPMDDSQGSASTNPKPEVKGSDSGSQGSDPGSQGSGSTPHAAETSSKSQYRSHIQESYARATGRTDRATATPLYVVADFDEQPEDQAARTGEPAAPVQTAEGRSEDDDGWREDITPFCPGCMTRGPRHVDGYGCAADPNVWFEHGEWHKRYRLRSAIIAEYRRRRDATGTVDGSRASA